MHAARKAQRRIYPRFRQPILGRLYEGAKQIAWPVVADFSVKGLGVRCDRWTRANLSVLVDIRLSQSCRRCFEGIVVYTGWQTGIELRQERSPMESCPLGYVLKINLNRSDASLARALFNPADLQETTTTPETSFE